MFPLFPEGESRGLGVGWSGSRVLRAAEGVEQGEPCGVRLDTLRLSWKPPTFP